MSRIDKYLWSVRIYKTRTDATEACRSGRIRINEIQAKPSKEIKPGDIISVRRGNIHFTYRVIADVERRQPAKMVDQYIDNITPQEELKKLNLSKESFFFSRERGTGRPTKKERRDIDELFDNLDFYYDNETEGD
jgi:ribosome-associated heat shock protein Hsp15